MGSRSPSRPSPKAQKYPAFSPQNSEGYRKYWVELLADLIKSSRRSNESIGNPNRIGFWYGFGAGS
jgi:hypothetical protein